MRWAAVLLFLLIAPAYAGAPASSARSTAVEARIHDRLAMDLAAKAFRLGDPVFIRIIKQPARLELFMQNAKGEFVLVKTYPICTFSGALGPKKRVGDGQAPEGFYYVTPARMNPYSSFHLSFDLGYPNAYDRALGRTGSALMVHGNCVSIGCYAMGDEAIEEIWTVMAAAFRAGQRFIRVHAFPYPMDAKRVPEAGPNADFWTNLKEGWDIFARNQRPPDVRVRNGRYVFSE